MNSLPRRPVKGHKTNMGDLLRVLARDTFMSNGVGNFRIIESRAQKKGSENIPNSVIAYL